MTQSVASESEPNEAQGSGRFSEASGPALLRVRDLRKTYRLGRARVEVLRGVDLEVHRRECVAILGASGSGKSTLLHLCGGLDRPDRVKEKSKGGAGSAAITFDAQEITRMSAGALDRYRARDVGFVFQFYHLLPELTVVQNVMLGGLIKAGPLGSWFGSRGLRTRAAELLSAFGLSHRLRHRPSQLSGGERQRVAIARSLINSPQLLLADEPTGNLDRATGAQIMTELFGLRERLGLTILMVTHDPAVAGQADRTVRIVDGRVESAGVRDADTRSEASYAVR